MLNGLDLFSGYGGISIALAEWVRPVAYCEIERYAQAILLSRMAEGLIPRAPICNDIRALEGNPWRGKIDIIYGGFPCQDISVAGAGKGMAGERSGLFREIVRLAKEIEPRFLFLENVPAIRLRGLDTVIEELTDAGFDLRWKTLSAQEIGAPHKRERWFLLAHSQRLELRNESGRSCGKNWKGQTLARDNGEAEHMAYSDGLSEQKINESDDTIHGQRKKIRRRKQFSSGIGASGGDQYGQNTRRDASDYSYTAGSRIPESFLDFFSREWWSTEPDVGRVVDGVAYRVDRIRACGNGVVPLQAKRAFEELMGLRQS